MESSASYPSSASHLSTYYPRATNTYITPEVKRVCRQVVCAGLIGGMSQMTDSEFLTLPWKKTANRVGVGVGSAGGFALLAQVLQVLLCSRPLVRRCCPRCGRRWNNRQKVVGEVFLQIFSGVTAALVTQNTFHQKDPVKDLLFDVAISAFIGFYVGMISLCLCYKSEQNFDSSPFSSKRGTGGGPIYRRPSLENLGYSREKPSLGDDNTGGGSGPGYRLYVPEIVSEASSAEDGAKEDGAKMVQCQELVRQVGLACIVGAVSHGFIDQLSGKKSWRQTLPYMVCGVGVTGGAGLVASLFLGCFKKCGERYFPSSYLSSCPPSCPPFCPPFCPSFCQTTSKTAEVFQKIVFLTVIGALPPLITEHFIDQEPLTWDPVIIGAITGLCFAFLSICFSHISQQQCYRGGRTSFKEESQAPYRALSAGNAQTDLVHVFTESSVEEKSSLIGVDETS